MILFNGRVNIFMCFLVFFISDTSTSQTKVYIFQQTPNKPLTLLQKPFWYNPHGRNFAPNIYLQDGGLSNRQNGGNYVLASQRDNRIPGRKLLSVLLINIIKQQDKKIADIRSECLRIFGSLHGNRDDKVRCLEDLKKRKFERNKLQKTLVDENYRVDGSPFTDYTRISDDYFGFENLQRSEFSTDYIDFDDLRLVKPANNYLTATDVDNDEIRDLQDWKDFRKSTQKKIKENNNIILRTTYSSDDEDSDISFEYKQNKNGKYVPVPKRFQVINNAKNKKERKTKKPTTKRVRKDDYESVTQMIFMSSEEAKPTKTSKSNRKNKHVYSSIADFTKSPKVKKTKFQHPSFQKQKATKNFGSEQSSNENVYTNWNIKFKENVTDSSDEFIFTIPRKKLKTEVYLQGNRVFTVSSDGRKRLEHFLPKRFHWDKEDLQNLGYYWFNGPQGKYSHYRQRS